MISGNMGGDLFAACLKSDFSPDSGFAQNGVYRFDYSSGKDDAIGICSFPGGKYYIAFNYTFRNFSGSAMVRLLSNGKPDTKYASSGFKEIYGYSSQPFPVTLSSVIKVKGKYMLGAYVPFGSFYKHRIVSWKFLIGKFLLKVQTIYFIDDKSWLQFYMDFNSSSGKNLTLFTFKQIYLKNGFLLDLAFFNLERSSI